MENGQADEVFVVLDHSTCDGLVGPFTIGRLDNMHSYDLYKQVIKISIDSVRRIGGLYVLSAIIFMDSGRRKSLHLDIFLLNDILFAWPAL